MPDEPFQAFVVSHTHWDREWYRTFQHFRMRLVDLADDLLDLLDKDPAYKYYYFDGQTVVIEDYLEIRPENAERLRKRFQEGRIYAGPWYVQPDEFLVSGESFIRNLFAGARLCREWSTGASVGYAPDAFGHTSQMPQILRGFGIDNAVLFRGITTDQVDSEFEWAAPDGTSVLCIKMPDANAYSNFYYRFRETLGDTDTGLPIDPDRVVREGTALLEDGLNERPTTSNLLWMDGVDHIFAQSRTPTIIDILNARLGNRVHVTHSTLPQYLDAVRTANPKLKRITGELRVSNRNWGLQALLAHVASSRMHTKQLNHRCETLLERWSEPFCAIAWTLGARHPEAYLRYAWKQLLLNQPHDSICGCSIDAVHRDMIPRYDQCLLVGEKITEDALKYIAGKIDTRSLKPANSAAPPVASLVVFNPLGWPRENELMEAVIDIPAEGAPDEISLWRPDGEPVPCTVETLKPFHRLEQAEHNIPIGVARKRWLARFTASVPAFGYAAYSIVGRALHHCRHRAEAVQVGENWLENSLLRVEVAKNGSIDITDKATGKTCRNGLVFESGGDFGDGYNYVKPKDDVIFTTVNERVSPGKGVWNYQDDTAGRLFLHHTWYVPAKRDGDGRSDTIQAPIHINAALTLAPGSERLDIALNVTNSAKDQRLRVLFPTGLTNATVCHAEQAFDVVERNIKLPDCTGWREPQPATGPQKSFVDVSDGEAGFCLINRGLPEYEVMDNAERTIALTLLRCTGNGVGAPEDQEEGQMEGAWNFEFSVFPHAADWLSSKVWREAHAFNTPLRAVSTTLHEGPLPVSGSFASVEPETMVPTALKRSEDGTGVVLRAVNYGNETVEATFTALGQINSATSVRLDETTISPMSASAGGKAEMEAASKRIVSVKFTTV